MKKVMTIIAITIFWSGIARAADIRIELKTNYFAPSDKAFKDIYGGGIMYGGELNIGIRQNLDLWLRGSRFSKKGELTFTREETKLRIVPLGGGIAYRISTRSARFYTGFGLNYYHYKESNPIGEVSKSGLGYTGRAGSYVKVIRGLLIDFFADYSYCKIKPADYEVNIGGLGLGIGIVYEF